MKALSPRITFLLILAIFTLPLVLAWLMYTGALEFGPTNTRNQGTLVQPPVPVDWSSTKQIASSDAPNELVGHWVVLYRVRTDCAVPCLDRATQLRQVHRASGRNQDRIRLALLFDREPADSEIATMTNIYPLFILLWPAEPVFLESLNEAQARVNAEVQPEAVAIDFYLIDPRGDIIMTYNESDSAAKLNKDLKTLMTWSEVDRR